MTVSAHRIETLSYTAKSHTRTTGVLMKQPTISVITATLNAAKELPSLIASLRNQSDPDFEWIVMDGCSTDGTVELLRSAEDVVSVWFSDEDFGIYDALNRGIKRCTGEYYLVVGADDGLDVDAIKNYKKAIEYSAADIVSARVNMDGAPAKRKPKKPWRYRLGAFVSSHAVGSIYRKALHERYGYYSWRYPIAADQLFVKTVYLGGSTIYDAEFLAGTYSKKGTSEVDWIGMITESYRVQLKTGENKFLQTALLFFRIMKNYRKVR